MDTRSCAHHTCDQEFTTNHPTKKYCNPRCSKNAAVARYFRTEKGKATKRKHSQSVVGKETMRKYHAKNDFASYRKDYYHSVTAPRGQRLSERLDSLFRSQAALDPSRLPQLASRVLSWRPKGYIEVAKYAKHPLGPLERDWLYYAEMSPEEAVVVYARED